MFGAIPALKHALQIDTPMSGSPRGSSASRERSATRSALVVVQVALALVLVVSAALMIRTFQALRDVDPGFSDPATIQTAGISIPFTLVSDPEQVTRVAKMTSLQHEILDRIAALPGVASVGFASDLPMAGVVERTVFVEGETIAAGERAALAQVELRLARLFRSHGHANDRRTRRDLERYRGRRPRGRDFRGVRSRARGRARGRTRSTYPVRRMRPNGTR